MDKTNQLQQELNKLKEDHKVFEAQLSALMKEAIPNHLEIRRLKKKKLGTKDQINILKNQLTPDIIA